jgi:ketosteroid isomerase-like protein
MFLTQHHSPALAAASALLISTLLLIGCASAPAPAPDTRAADEATLRKLDEDWVKAGQARDVAGWVSFYSSDAVVLPPNEKIATTPDAIKASVAGLLTLPEANVKWQPAKIEVAKAGDLAYLYGAYQLSFQDAKTKKTVNDTGKILEIWKKQANGSWKCIVDTWNSDLPAVP